MDWDDLRVFLAVARAESLSGAGKALRLDPATVLAHAERAEAAMAGVVQDVQGDRGLTGQIRIGAPDGCANYLLPQVVAAICDANPGLEVQIVALPRVFNLSKREADMAIAVSRPEAGRLTVQKLSDYRLHLAASRDYTAAHPVIETPQDLHAHRVVGYIPDMIFDKELDYLAAVGAGAVPLASNSVSVQLNWLRHGAGVGIVHDFAMPSAPELVKIIPDQISLTRAFWLIRHADDGRVERLNRFAGLLAQGIRREVNRLESMT
jgi:DNA-binding transcriptional LysR family regulator